MEVRAEIMTELSEEQPVKAESPRDLTELGILIDKTRDPQL